MASAVTVLISGYDSPEGPAFDRDGNLYFVNWLCSAIIRLTPDGGASEFFNTGGIPAGLAFHRDGSLYVADEGDDIHGVLRIGDGQATVLVNEYDGKPLNGANDLVFDPRRRALFFRSLAVVAGASGRRLLPPLSRWPAGAHRFRTRLPQRRGPERRRIGGVPGGNGNASHSALPDRGGRRDRRARGFRAPARRKGSGRHGVRRGRQTLRRPLWRGRVAIFRSLRAIWPTRFQSRART